VSIPSKIYFFPCNLTVELRAAQAPGFTRGVKFDILAPQAQLTTPDEIRLGGVYWCTDGGVWPPPKKMKILLIFKPNFGINAAQGSSTYFFKKIFL